MRNAGRHIVFYTILAMLISLFISRAALSISMFGFVAAALLTTNPGETFKTFLRTPFLWLMSLLFFLPLISGLWSENTDAWFGVVRVKLPLLLLPFAFAANIALSRKQWSAIAIFFILLVLAGTAWSMGHYITSPGEVQEGYLRSQTMRTPLEHDHVRFSWLVSLTILVCGWMFPNVDRKEWRWAIIGVAGWFILFLHILAARTGLVGFYLIVCGFIIWLVARSARPAIGFGLLIALVSLPLAAYFLLPTFQNRIKFIRYDFGYLKDAHFLPGGNDATRVISFRAGVSTLLAKPVVGVGYGDIRQEVDEWYALNHPEIPPAQRILPSNQWLLYGAGCGVPGILALTLALTIPFFMRMRRKGAWTILNLLVLFPFLYDIGLEVQFGIIIYCLSALLGWKWFRHDELKN